MQMTSHIYQEKPSRYFIDGKRVSKDRFEQEQIFANMRGARADSFLTTCIQNDHYKHTFSING